MTKSLLGQKLVSNNLATIMDIDELLEFFTNPL